MKIHRYSATLLAAVVGLWMLTLTPALRAQDAPKVPEVVQNAADNVADAAAEVKDAVKDASEEVKDEAAEEKKCEESNCFKNTFWALVPPLLAIVLALITKEVYSSLFIGVVLGGCFAAKFKLLAVIDTVVKDGIIAAVSDTAGVFIFLVTLGILVAIINRTGTAGAFGDWAKTHVKTRIGTTIATFVLGVLIFIDDYFNCLTVGSVMLPVTDAKKISRAKLAFLIDATAAPICMIAPVSSWAAAVSSYAEGTGMNGMQMFIRAIPYNFYSLLTFVFIILISFFCVDFGPMLKHERNAIYKDDLFSGSAETEETIKPMENARGRVLDIIAIILMLIVVCTAALAYNGGITEGKSLADAFGDTDATVALPWGGLVVLVLTVFYLAARRVMSPRKTMDCVVSGFGTMVPPILILTLATSLKNMTGLLNAKEYVATLMTQAAPSLQNFMPAVLFLVACVLSFSTGTSWGTFGILIPIVVNIFPVDNPLLFIGMSACLAGSVCGDHCSPISDTTIMSAAGARCELISHVSTQLPYAITVAAISCLGFIIAGWTRSWCLSFFPVAVLMLILVAVLKAKGYTASKQA